MIYDKCPRCNSMWGGNLGMKSTHKWDVCSNYCGFKQYVISNDEYGHNLVFDNEMYVLWCWFPIGFGGCAISSYIDLHHIEEPILYFKEALPFDVTLDTIKLYITFS